MLFAPVGSILPHHLPRSCELKFSKRTVWNTKSYAQPFCVPRIVLPLALDNLSISYQFLHLFLVEDSNKNPTDSWTSSAQLSLAFYPESSTPVTSNLSTPGSGWCLFSLASLPCFFSQWLLSYAVWFKYL